MESPPDHRPRLSVSEGGGGRALDFPGGQENPACRRRAHGLDPWSRKSPCVTGQQSVCVTTTEAGVPWRMRTATKRGARPLQLEKAVRSSEDPRSHELINEEGPGTGRA